MVWPRRLRPGIQGEGDGELRRRDYEASGLEICHAAASSGLCSTKRLLDPGETCLSIEVNDFPRLRCLSCLLDKAPQCVSRGVTAKRMRKHFTFSHGVRKQLCTVGCCSGT